MAEQKLDGPALGQGPGIRVPVEVPVLQGTVDEEAAGRQGQDLRGVEPGVAQGPAPYPAGGEQQIAADLPGAVGEPRRVPGTWGQQQQAGGFDGLAGDDVDTGVEAAALAGRR